jgi:hypothetical protein
VNREEALQAADSLDWEERVVAAKFLTKYDDDEVAAALGRLLLDRLNTAVIEETARELLKRDDLYAIGLIFGAVALAPSEVNDHLFWLIRAAEHEGRLDLEARTSDLTATGSAWTRAGLHQYLEWRS